MPASCGRSICVLDATLRAFLITSKPLVVTAGRQHRENAEMKGTEMASSNMGGLKDNTSYSQDTVWSVWLSVVWFEIMLHS